MKQGTILLIAVAIISMSAYRVNILRGEGKKVTVANSVALFDNIRTSVPVNVVITVAGNSPESVQISGYENVVKHITTTVTNGTLKISTDLNRTWKRDDNDETTVTITMPALTALEMSGAANASIHGNLAGKKFDMGLSGAAGVSIDSMMVEGLTATVTGAGDIKIRGGAVQTAWYNISGAGSVKAFKMKSQETRIDISGAGDAEVTAVNRLTAKVSGAGSVKYKGHPDINQTVSGAGEVKNANTDKVY